MALQCNIDARGKAVRLVWGSALLLLGIVLAIVWALPASGWLAWTVSIGLTVGGAFAIFESRAGWCALRAMGIRTKI